MYNWADLLDEIESTPRGKKREAKTADVVSEQPELLEVFKYAMDPLITFGVQAVPKATEEPKVGGTVSFGEVKDTLLEPLRNRELTGNKATEAIVAMMNRLNVSERDWLKRIISQKLRISLGPKTINGIAPGTIFQFSIPLAEPFSKAKDKDLKAPWVVQPKADGGRVVAELPGDGGPVRMLSRTGHNWENFESIRLALEEINAARPNREKVGTIYLDGEVVSYVDGRINFQAIQKTMLSTKTKAVIGDLVFYVFDGAEKTEWENPTRPYKDRYASVQDFLRMFNNPAIRLMPKIREIYYPTAESLEEDMIRAVEEGWEGLMLRRLDKPVVMDRSIDLLKVKEFDDMEATIVDVEEGEGNRAGMAGRLVLVDDLGIEFRAGSGLTHADSIELFNNKEKYIGEKVRVKYFQRTDDNKPRFPTVDYFRHEEDT